MGNRPTAHGNTKRASLGKAGSVWLASEHKPYGFVAVDRTGAHFFHYWFGEIVEHGQKKFDIDTSQWKKKELGHFTGQGIRKTRGTQRDVFEKRMVSQYARLCRETAQQAADLCGRMHLAAVFVVGPERLIKQIKAKFPKGALWRWPGDLIRFFTNVFSAAGRTVRGIQSARSVVGSGEQ